MGFNEELGENKRIHITLADNVNIIIKLIII